MLIAIVRKRLGLEASLYQILQILSVTLFEKMPVLQALQPSDSQNESPYDPNQLILVGYPFDSGSHKMLWSRESIYQEANPEVTALARRGAA